MLDKGIFVSPDSATLFSQFGADFAAYFEGKGVNLERLAGAEVLTINGLPAYAYIDEIARNVSGEYLSHGVRVNSVFSSYQISGTFLSRRLGDLAGSSLLTQRSLTFTLIPKDSTSPETVGVPFVSSFVGNSFTDGPS